ncbi:M48 family metallopeptidase [Leptospira sp. 96542]|nr:M48 family metallopeptidase [Leptospira sp. 96542]
MIRNRFFYFFSILIFGTVLSILTVNTNVQVQFPTTLSPAFQLLGKPIKTLDRSLTKIIPIDDLDEKKLGDSIALRYESYADKKDPDLIYLENLVSHLTKNKHKKFNYRVFLMNSEIPNAYAMPGGVLFVTKGLLNILDSESQLVAILGHEIGHVELSHCMDGVRGELFAKKIKMESFGVLADITTSILLRPSFSKNQEDEADGFGFDILIREKYDPYAMGQTFLKLKKSEGGIENKNSAFHEYFMTHPYLSHRFEKYTELAKLKPVFQSYIGKRNFQNKITRYETEYEAEYIF